MNPWRSSGSLVYGSPGGQFRAGAGVGAIQCGSPVCGVVSLAAVGAGWGLGFWVSVLTHLRAKRNRHPKETVMRKLSFQKRHRKHTFSMSLHYKIQILNKNGPIFFWKTQKNVPIFMEQKLQKFFEKSRQPHIHLRMVGRVDAFLGQDIQMQIVTD